MLIPSFRVENQRSIKIAVCDKVPVLMIIAGPNGVGKSTLLNALKHAHGGQVLYVGPHRNSRRQNVQYRSLLSIPISLEKILMQPTLNNNIEGLAIYQGNRDPWDSDEALNYLKHGLCQLEIERKDAISTIFDRDGKIDAGILPDIWQPLKELTQNLLPHLAFHSIDTTNKNNIRCLWQVHSKSTLVDLDELSSGEKAIIQLFYPLIEQRIQNTLRSIEGGLQSITGGSEGIVEHAVTILIDEPELHLHPNLQFKILDYFRILCNERNVQVIMATHSPTLVEYATSDELFLLKPYELLQEGDNQLVRIASDEEKLSFLKNIFGTTSNLTAMQSLVVVEGIRQKNSSKVISDRKLYRALSEKFDKVTVLPGGGKSECIKLIESLDETLKDFSPNLKVFGLLDKDIVSLEHRDNICLLPVSMIENFLVDPDSMWEAIQSVIEKTSINNHSDLEKKMDDILNDFDAQEIERRVIHFLDKDVFRPHSPIADIQKQLKDHIGALNEKYDQENITRLLVKSTEDVTAIKQGNTRRENYKGKDVLSEFYKRHLHSTGLAKEIFLFETARHARKRKSVKAFFDQFFSRLFG